MGYYYDETTTIRTAIIDKATGQITDLERIETKTTKRYARPAIGAIAYFLNNRDPQNWKNKVTVDGENDNGILKNLIEAIKQEQGENAGKVE